MAEVAEATYREGCKERERPPASEIQVSRVQGERERRVRYVPSRR